MTARLLAMPDNRAAEAVSITGKSETAPLTEAVIRALNRLGLNDKELSAVLRVTPAQFSRQKASRDGHYLQVQRFDAALPKDLRERFLWALLEELAKACGVTIATPQGHLRDIADAMESMSSAIRKLSATGQHALPFESEAKRA